MYEQLVTTYIRLIDRTAGEIIDTVHWDEIKKELEDRVTNGHIVEVRLIHKFKGEEHEQADNN